MNEKPYFSSRVRKIIMFINESFAQDISLKEICLAVNLSDSHCERIFKQEVGVPVKKFLILKRLYEAARILRAEPNISESDVLSHCSFDDLSNFIRQFKKNFGCPPIQFRNCGRDPRKCRLWKQSNFRILYDKPRDREALGIDVPQPCLLERIKKAKK